MLTWIIRELTVCQKIPLNKEIHIKLTLDRRPFASKNQVLVGIVCTTDFENAQSALRVFSLCIVNSKESLELFIEILKPIIADKRIVEANGIEVDNVQYLIIFFGKHVCMCV